MKLVSAKEILFRLRSNLGYLTDIDELSIYNWVNEALRDMNIGSGYVIKTIDAELSGYEYHLPCDYSKIYGVFIGNVRVPQQIPAPDSTIELSYFFQNECLIFSKPDQSITLIYYSTLYDEQGIPLIPDMELVKTALFWYVTHWLHYQQWLEGKDYERKYRDAKQNWVNYRSLAVNKAKLPTLDEMKAFAKETLNLGFFTNDAGSTSSSVGATSNIYGIM